MEKSFGKETINGTRDISEEFVEAQSQIGEISLLELK